MAKKSAGTTGNHATPDSVRNAWNARLDAAFPYPGQSVWREASGWAPTWDRVARDFREGMPSEIVEARRLEEIAGNLRRRVELAFVSDDAADTVEVSKLVRRILREADLALGIPRSAKKRRRFQFMRFLEQCVRAGLSAWPDFDDLAGGPRPEGLPPSPDVGYVPATGPDDEEGWLRIVDLKALREALTELGDLPNVPKPALDELVVAWSRKRAGAKATGSGQRSAYYLLGRTLRAAWGDATAATQLKREWFEANPYYPRNRS